MTEDKKEEKVITQKEINQAEIKVNGFLNPFSTGVTYADFLEEVGKKTVAEYCKGKLDKDQIEWLEKDIELIK